MRLAIGIAVLACISCKKAEPDAPVRPVKPTPIVPSPPAIDAGVASLDAPPITEIDVLHDVATTITVSSTVANPKILPAQIADGDLATAWNSFTGMLAGEWIEIAPAGGVTITEIRMTVGFTAKGPKGEDWFTMNHRIAKVSLFDGTELVGEGKLDIANRGLQSIVLATPSNQVRIRIDAVVPGSMKTWREAAISELEVRGSPPYKFVPPTAPLRPTVVVATMAPTGNAFDALCAEERARAARFEDDDRRRRKDCEESHPNGGDGLLACQAETPSRPQCELVPIEIENAAPPFGAATFKCTNLDMSPIPWMCEPWVTINGKLVASEPISAEQTDIGIRIDPTVERAAIAGKELVLTYGGATFACVASPIAKCTKVVRP